MSEAEEKNVAAGAKTTTGPNRKLPEEVQARLKECRNHNPNRLWMLVLIGACVAVVIGVKQLLARQNTARLFEAAVLADAARLDGMLEYGAEVNGVIDGDTPLIAASRGGNVGSVQALLARGALVNPEGLERIPLHVAAANGHLEVAKLLLDAGANVEELDGLGQSALSVAARAGESQVVAFLLERGASVTHGEPNAAPMLVAIRGLIEQLPPAEGESSDPETVTEPPAPRELAPQLWGRYERTMELLVEAGADVDAVGSLGETPLLLAVEADLPTVAETLLEFGADLAKTTEFGSPLIYAVQRRRWEVARKLVPTGPDSALREELGMAALREAVLARNHEFMVYLIANGAGTSALPPGHDGDSTSAKGTELVITELYRRFTNDMIAMLGDPYEDPNSPVGRAFFRNRIKLNGISEFLTVGERSDAALNRMREITVSCWVKPRSVGSKRVEGQYLLSRHRRGVNTGFELYLDGDMLPVWVIYNGEQAYEIRDDKPLRLGKWTHLAATSGRGRMALFVNGALRVEASAPSVLCEKSGYLHIGRSATSELGYFAGELQFVAIYLERIFESGFKPEIMPVRPEEAYLLIQGEDGNVFDQTGRPVTAFPAR